MKKALLIGINYADIPGDTLHGCIEDIENIAEVLMNQYGYNEQDIVMLRDDIADPSVTPTHANMIQAIKNIVAISSSCTQIWIHYSGHGSLINNGKTGGHRSIGLFEEGVHYGYGDDEYIEKYCM